MRLKELTRKIEWKELLLHIGVPLAVGGLAAFLSRDGMAMFKKLKQPPLSPPAWLFPVAWTILYTLMGIASYQVSRKTDKQEAVCKSLTVYGISLIFNFFCTLIFFNQGRFLLAFVWLLILIVLIGINMYCYHSLNKTAARLLLPYFLWCCFAGYLNFGVYCLNR